MTGEPTHTASKLRKKWHRVSQLYPLSSEKWIIHYTSLSATHVQPVTQQYESRTVRKVCNQSSHYEKYRRCCYKRKPSCATTNLALFAVSKDEWDTKEDTKSPWRMHCTYCGMPKAPSNVEQWKNQVRSLSRCQVMRLSEGICQLLSQSVTQSVSYSVSQSVENSVK